MKIAKIAGVVALSLAAAACGNTDKLNALSGLEVEGTDFNSALARNYNHLAQWEADQYDWLDQRTLAAKGLDAAAGADVPPSDPVNWSLEGDALTETTEARSDLLTLYERGAREKAPTDSAVAQVKYDCWVEQLEEGWQAEHIADCRSDFKAAMKRIEATLAPKEPAKKKAAPAPKEEEPAKMPSFMVFFDFDSARLTATAQEVIADVTQAAEKFDYDFIDVVGHADRAGPANYNMGLSLERAEAVRNALVGEGLPGDKVAVSAQGETQPLVPTPDGVPEPQNRRVEMTLR